MNKFLVAAFFVLFANITLRSADEDRIGSIEGTVTYEDGRPVRGATAYATPGDRAIAGILPHAETDENGHFVIRRLWLGKFMVSAKKEDEGYPEPTYAFQVGMTTEVNLTASNPIAGVSLRLGPKAGIITGTVTDVTTGSLVYPCAKLSWKDRPNIFVEGTGLVSDKYRVLVPSDKDVMLKVWVDGYQNWFYPGVADQEAAKALRLKPGEELRLDIKLQPDSGRLVECPAGHGVP
jgi:hypothetical protein